MVQLRALKRVRGAAGDNYRGRRAISAEYEPKAVKCVQIIQGLGKVCRIRSPLGHSVQLHQLN